MQNRDRTYIKVEVTLANNRKEIIEHSVEPGWYDSDLATLHEVYGEKNVKEIHR